MESTNNLTSGDRVYILGSTRSSKWYFQDIPEDKVVSRKDLEYMSAEFPNFKYLVIDRNEALKGPNNVLSKYIVENRSSYDLIRIDELDVYVRI